MNYPPYPKDAANARRGFSAYLCSLTLLGLNIMLHHAHWSPGDVTTTAGRLAVEYRNQGSDAPWLGNMVEQLAYVFVHSSGYACTVDASWHFSHYPYNNLYGLWFKLWLPEDAFEEAIQNFTELYIEDGNLY